MATLYEILSDKDLRWELAENLFAEELELISEELGHGFVPGDGMQKDRIEYIDWELKLQHKYFEFFSWEEVKEEVKWSVNAYCEAIEACTRAAASRLPCNGNEKSWILPVN